MTILCSCNSKEKQHIFLPLKFPYQTVSVCVCVCVWQSMCGGWGRRGMTSITTQNCCHRGLSAEMKEKHASLQKCNTPHTCQAKKTSWQKIFFFLFFFFCNWISFPPPWFSKQATGKSLSLILKKKKKKKSGRKRRPGKVNNRETKELLCQMQTQSLL